MGSWAISASTSRGRVRPPLAPALPPDRPRPPPAPAPLLARRPRRRPVGPCAPSGRASAGMVSPILGLRRRRLGDERGRRGRSTDVGRPSRWRSGSSGRGRRRRRWRPAGRLASRGPPRRRPPRRSAAGGRRTAAGSGATSPPGGRAAGVVVARGRRRRSRALGRGLLRLRPPRGAAGGACGSPRWRAVGRGRCRPPGLAAVGRSGSGAVSAASTPAAVCVGAAAGRRPEGPGPQGPVRRLRAAGNVVSDMGGFPSHDARTSACGGGVAAGPRSMTSRRAPPACVHW